MKRTLRTAAAVLAGYGIEVTPTQALGRLRELRRIFAPDFRKEGWPAPTTDEGMLFFLEVQKDAFLCKGHKKR